MAALGLRPKTFPNRINYHLRHDMCPEKPYQNARQIGRFLFRVKFVTLNPTVSVFFYEVKHETE